MAKTKKHTLDFEVEIEFDLIGIASHHNDYRLAWGINEKLNFQFNLISSNLIVTRGKKGKTETLSFPRYHHYDELNRVNYYLIKNKELAYLLVPEHPSINYFMFIDRADVIPLNQLKTKLKEVSSVLAVFDLDKESIDSLYDIEFQPIKHSH